ncbi:hypothetical protein YPPY54_3306, partial [Yersinia pestis PY-54]|jgi:hypothetical protein
MSES